MKRFALIALFVTLALTPKEGVVAAEVKPADTAAAATTFATSTAQPAPAEGYSEFTEPLYTAWFDGTNFYFYHDSTEGGYFEGHESIGKLAESLRDQFDQKYSRDNGYYGYTYSLLDDTYEIIGDFKNTSKYLDPSRPFMSVVKITCPLLPMTSPYDPEAEALKAQKLLNQQM